MSTKLYDIWAEGYRATGQHGEAMRMAKDVEARSFKEACIRALGDDRLFDPVKLSYWGCRLYDNETDARKLFG